MVSLPRSWHTRRQTNRSCELSCFQSHTVSPNMLRPTSILVGRDTGPSIVDETKPHGGLSLPTVIAVAVLSVIGAIIWIVLTLMWYRRRHLRHEALRNPEYLQIGEYHQPARVAPYDTHAEPDLFVGDIPDMPLAKHV